MLAVPVSPDMIIGMIIGMIASPLLMKAVKNLRQKIRVNRILDEVARSRNTEG